MLSHLVYVSVRKANCTADEIDKILGASKRNNNPKEVTGVLLYSNTHFVQYLEGEYNKIMSLYDKIKEDERHKNVVLITSGPIKERSFPSWEMGCKKFDEEKFEIESEMNKAEMDNFKQILAGKGQEGNRALELMKKFFK